MYRLCLRYQLSLIERDMHDLLYLLNINITISIGSLCVNPGFNNLGFQKLVFSKYHCHIFLNRDIKILIFLFLYSYINK